MSHLLLLALKFLAEKEIASDSRFIDVSYAGSKFSVTTNISELVDLKGQYPPEIIYFSQCVI
jgi:hypothetical protein